MKPTFPSSSTMPKVPSAAGDTVPKEEPYSKSSPQKGRARPITWTEEMDKAMISHVLSRSEIRFNFDWPALQKSTFPELSVQQVRNGYTNATPRLTDIPHLFRLLAFGSLGEEGQAFSDPRRGPEEKQASEGGGAKLVPRVTDLSRRSRMHLRHSFIQDIIRFMVRSSRSDTREISRTSRAHQEREGILHPSICPEHLA